MRLYCERTMGGEHKTSDPINGSKAGQKSRSARLGNEKRASVQREPTAIFPCKLLEWPRTNANAVRKPF